MAPQDSAKRPRHAVRPWHLIAQRTHQRQVAAVQVRDETGHVLGLDRTNH